MKFYGDLSNFQIQFLALTHIIATIYVAYSALIASKVMYASMFIIYIVSVLQMFYSGARPFWMDNSVLTSSCQSSYNHPSLGLILMVFIPFYIYYCSTKKVGRAFLGTIPNKHLILGSVTLLFAIFLQFLNYFFGCSVPNVDALINRATTNVKPVMRPCSSNQAFLISL